MRNQQNKTFSELARRVDEELQNYRDVIAELEDAERTVNNLRVRKANTLTRLEARRDELFEAHPELRPAPAQPAAQTPSSGGQFETVEVDDPDDVPGLNDGGPDFGPIEFRERD